MQISSETTKIKPLENFLLHSIYVCIGATQTLSLAHVFSYSYDLVLLHLSASKTKPISFFCMFGAIYNLDVTLLVCVAYFSLCYELSRIMLLVLS